MDEKEVGRGAQLNLRELMVVVVVVVVGGGAGLDKHRTKATGT